MFSLMRRSVAACLVTARVLLAFRPFSFLVTVCVLLRERCIYLTERVMQSEYCQGGGRERCSECGEPATDAWIEPARADSPERVYPHHPS
jgi:hypothetical protein